MKKRRSRWLRLQLKLLSPMFKSAFHFLEAEYDYHFGEVVGVQSDFKDSFIAVRYVGRFVGVEVSWYFADASIVVSFVELLQPLVFPLKFTFVGSIELGTAKAIKLTTLAELAGHQDDPDFLLPDSDNTANMSSKAIIRQWKAKSKKIQENGTQAIVDGLARATQTYASSLVKGDTSEFFVVMRFYTRKMNAEYPGFNYPDP